MQETFHVTLLLKLLDKMYKYEMDQTRTVGTRVDTECGMDGWTDWRTDGWTDGQSETNIPTLLCRGYNYLI